MGVGGCEWVFIFVLIFIYILFQVYLEFAFAIFLRKKIALILSVYLNHLALVYGLTAIIGIWQICFFVSVGGRDDRKIWANTVVNMARCWTNSAFMTGLSNDRSQQDKENLVNQLYERLEMDIVQKDPRLFKNGSLLVYVFAQKI